MLLVYKTLTSVNKWTSAGGTAIFSYLSDPYTSRTRKQHNRQKLTEVACFAGTTMGCLALKYNEIYCELNMYVKPSGFCRSMKSRQ